MTNSPFALAVLLAAVGRSLLGQTPPAPMQVLIASDFDDPVAGVDGWWGSNSYNPTITLAYHASNGNPQGYISVSESAGDDAFMYFVAPAKFLGDKRAAYNGILTLEMKQTEADRRGFDHESLLFHRRKLTECLLEILPSGPGAVTNPSGPRIHNRPSWRTCVGTTTGLG